MPNELSLVCIDYEETNYLIWGVMELHLLLNYHNEFYMLGGLMVWGENSFSEGWTVPTFVDKCSVFVYKLCRFSFIYAVVKIKQDSS